MELSRRDLIRAGIVAISGGAAVRSLGNASLFASDGGGGTALLVRRGRLVTAERQWDADIRVREGKIVEIARNLRTRDDERVIDAAGLQVLPGGIDPHAHLLPSWVDDYLSRSKAALAGGITTIGCMVSMQRGDTILDAIKCVTGYDFTNFTTHR
jgi:hypothetical protein